MATATSYDVASNIGAAALNREDLTDFLSIVAPEERPITSAANKVSAKQILHEFGMDILNEVQFGGYQEDQDVTAHENQAKDRARSGNYCEGFRDTWKVSIVQEATSTAGVASEIAASKNKVTRQIMRSLEAAVGSDNDLQAATAGQPYKMRGLGSSISASAPSATPTYGTNYLTPSGSIDATATASFTEALLNGVIQTVSEKTGDFDQNLRLVAGGNLKGAISEFTRQEGATTATPFTVNSNATEKTIILSVNLYDSDFGKVEIVPTNFNGRQTNTAIDNQTRARGYLYPPSLLRLASLIPFTMIDNEDQGGGTRGFAHLWATIINGNPSAFGKFNATS